MAGSRIAVYGAIGANVAIAVTKFVVAGVTGSAAMASEGIHSAVDTGNGLLLLVGTRLSEREPSIEHPFGHGKELYFWSLIVAVLIFGLGGGLSAYEGFQRVMHPEPMKSVGWNYVVLAAAAVFEGTSLTIALRQFLREKGTRPFWEALHGSKDPTTYTVLAEDSAAIAGLVLAAVGVFVSDRFGVPAADGIASMAIGVLLAFTAVLLVREARGLLIGEGLRPDTLVAIRGMVTADPLVRRVGRILSMYIGPDEVLLAFDVQFTPEAPATEVAAAVTRLEDEIRARYPRISRIYIEPRTIEVTAPLRGASRTPANA
ncbi:MAG TPA: cation diffusion facilitator family transporter [Casimicrobiaceae bacterium]|nr:cation diffusion facilitator family transporter [Casimicrobiaceae bacterium]